MIIIFKYLFDNQELKNGFCVDFLTFVIMSITNPYELITNLLGLDASRFTLKDGRYNYKHMLQYSNINVYYDGTPKMGLCVEMSGQGCREYIAQRKDPEAVYKLLQMLRSVDRVTRIDLAFDDYCGILDFGLIVDKTTKKEVRTKLRWHSELISNDGERGHTVYYGSKSSDYRVRIYDKAAEQREDIHWIRVEAVLRHDIANNFVQHALGLTSAEATGLSDNFQKAAASLLMGRLAFIVRSDSNISRCKVCDWWADFLNNAEPISIRTKVTAPTVIRASAWAFNAAAQTIVALILLLGADWLIKLLEHGFRHRKTRYKNLLAAYTAVGETPAFESGATSDQTFFLTIADKIMEVYGNG